MDAIPTPSPTRILPKMMTLGDGARAITSAPAKKRTSATRIDIFLPNLSLIHPPTAAPTMAPATAILTMVSYDTLLQVWNSKLNAAVYILYVQK